MISRKKLERIFNDKCLSFCPELHPDSEKWRDSWREYLSITGCELKESPSRPKDESMVYVPNPHQYESWIGIPNDIASKILVLGMLP